MNKLFYTLMLLCFWTAHLASSARPVSTSSTYLASQNDAPTLSGVMPFGEEQPLRTTRRRSQEETYASSDITGPTGLNALAAKTESLLTPPTSSLSTTSKRKRFSS